MTGGATTARLGTVEIFALQSTVRLDSLGRLPFVDAPPRKEPLPAKSGAELNLPNWANANSLDAFGVSAGLVLDA